MIDFHRRTPGPHFVERLEYDPNRTASLCLLRNMATNELSYIIQPKDIKRGDIVESFADGIPPPLPGKEPLPKFLLIKPGNCLKLKDIPVGTIVHNIGLYPGGPAQLCRSAGTSGQILYTVSILSFIGI